MDKTSEQSPVESLAEEFLERKRRGENPSITEYAEKYPHLASEIEDIFPALELMEDFKPTSGDLTDESGGTAAVVPGLKQVGDYRILKEVGRGGMGVVYEAEQQSLGRRVALKVLPKSSVGGTKMIERFQREARAAAKMHHTNIVPVFDVGHDDQCAFYAMQLIQGQGLDFVIGDLRELRSSHISGSDSNDKQANKLGDLANHSLARSLISGHFDVRKMGESDDRMAGDSDADAALTDTIIQKAGSTVSASLPGESDLSTVENNRRAYHDSVAEIGLQCAQALSYAHARGIIHRDIKPSNLVLDTNGVVWVTDFGLAKTSDVGLTHTGDILGTIRYMSPERFKGQCDNRADIYSLGLTLYEMLVLKPAFESSDRLKLIDIVTKTEVTAPRSIDSRIPRDLETIVLKACDKDPKRRYQSADEMADDIQRFVSDEPILARRAAAAERVARWTRRNPWLATALTISASALIAITGISVVAAQTQTALNEQLTEANIEQSETNQALAASNKTKEQLIEDLTRSQQRLAEKQAELVAEKGDLAESMLWLARAHELTNPSDSDVRNRLMSKLTQASQKMPALLSEHTIERPQNEFALVPYVYRVRNPNGSEEPEVIEGILKRSFGRKVFGRKQTAVRSTNLLVLPASRVDPVGNPLALFRCYDLRTGRWTGKSLEIEGVHQACAINEQNRWLATVAYTVKPVDPITKEEDSNTIEAIVERLTQVRSIDSGDVVWQDRLTIHSLDNPDFIPYVMQQLQTRIDFSPDSNALLRIEVQKGKPGQFDLERIAIPSGEVTRDNVSLLALATTSGLFTQRMEISDDRKRLRLVGTRRTAFIRNTMQQTEIVSLDFETGTQIGKSVRFDDALPLFFSGSDHLVAVIRKDGNRRRIQVHDINSGQQIGKAFELNVPIDTELALRAGSADGSRVAVSFAPLATRTPAKAKNREPLVHGWVQVIDLQSNSVVTPRLPTLGEAIDVAMTDDDRIIVRDQRQLRTWQLSGGMIDRSLVVADTTMSSMFNLALPLIRALPKGELLAAGRFAEAEVTTWSGEAGKKIATIRIPAEEHRVLAFDWSGEFVLTGVGRKSRSKNKSPIFADAFEIQSWALDTQTPVGSPIELPSEHVPVCLASDGYHVALVVQPKVQPNPLAHDPYRIRIQNLQTKSYRDLVMPTGRIQPAFVQFDSSGQRLFVISGPKTTLDTFDLSGAEIVHLEASSLDGFASGPAPMASVTFSNGSWAVSGDGQLVAGYREDGSLQVTSVVDGTALHTIPLRAEDNSITTSPLPTSFTPEGESICFARPGGFIFRSKIPDRWSGSPEQIAQRLKTTIGLRLGSDESVEFANLSNKGSWTASDDATELTLEHREFQTIQHVFNEEWPLANTELQAWLERRPDDSLPLPLLMLSFVEQNKFDEADDVLASFVEKVGSDTAAEWLRRLANSRKWADPGTGVSSLDEPSSEELHRISWFHRHRVEQTQGKERVRVLLEWATNLEQQYDLEGAAIALNKAVQIDPDSVQAHRQRFRLLGRLERWDAAIESHHANVRLRPDDKWAHYYRLIALLHASDKTAFQSAWYKFREQFPGPIQEELGKEWEAIRLRDFLAKPRLVFGGESDDSLRLALRFADANHKSEREMKTQRAAWRVLCKGLAEYRRGATENLEESIRLLEIEFPAFVKREPRRYWAAQGFARFVAAMAYHRLGQVEDAESVYLDGLDWHRRAGDALRTSSTAPANDWQLAEVLRREAEQLLKIDEAQIAPAITSTSNWHVVLSDDFDKGIRNDWEQLDGQWSIVDGAACGILEESQAANVAFCRLERAIPGSPSTFEIQYETWMSDPMLAACFFRQPPSKNLFGILGLSSKPANEDPLGLRVALASRPDRLLTHQGKPGTGVNLLTLAPFGHWITKSVPDFHVVPNRHYKVRIIRQPQRITVFVDGQQVMSERVRNIETKTIRFFARGDGGDKMYVDNVRVSIPTKAIEH